MPSAVGAVLLVAVVPAILALNLRTGGPEEVQQAARQLQSERRHGGRWGYGSNNSTMVSHSDDDNDDDLTDCGRSGVGGKVGRARNYTSDDGDCNRSGRSRKDGGARNYTGSADDDSISDEAYSHIGCFEITEDIFNGYDASNLSYSNIMRTDRCYKKCARKKATFMALSNGFICWCGDKEEDQYTRGGVGMCDSPCRGGRDMMCGGEEAFDLYRIKGDAVTSTMPSKHMKNISSTGDDSEPSLTEARPTRMPRGRSTSSPVMVDMEPTPTPTASSPIVPPTFTPVASVTMSPTAKTSDTTDGSFTASTDMETLPALHNLARCEHNADSLTYSKTVAASAAAYAQVLASACGNLIHSDSPYGENLYMCNGSTTCYSPENAMAALYESEVNGRNITQYGGHATQILWKSTEELGCGLGYCGDRTYLVCQYNPPGNKIGLFEENVERPSGNRCYP